jgi:hypothetical protein
MDTLTHALIGALVVRAATPGKVETTGVDPRTRTWVGGLAAAFPDIDCPGFWLAPLTFLSTIRPEIERNFGLAAI